MQLQLHYANYTTPQLQLHYATTTNCNHSQKTPSSPSVDSLNNQPLL